MINGLSDHNVQILAIKNTYATINKFPLKQGTRLITSEKIINIQTLLKADKWESLYKDKNPTSMFNSFLFTFLNIFQPVFQLNTKV
jgi:hypothetical protein